MIKNSFEKFLNSLIIRVYVKRVNLSASKIGFSNGFKDTTIKRKNGNTKSLLF